MMTLIESQLPSSVLADIRDWYTENSQGMPSPLTLDQALFAYMEWNGIIGHKDSIMSIIMVAAKP